MYKLLIPEPPLQVLPTLARLLGINEAIMLQQLHYWLLRSINEVDGYLWSWKTNEGWSEEMPWLTPEGCRKVITRLRDKGLVIVDNHNKRKSDRTLWYRIDYTNPFFESIPHSYFTPVSNQLKLATLPETTTETTSIYKTTTKAQKKKFCKPTIEELSAYVDTLGCPTEEASKFFDYFESKGWLVGKAPMKNWQAAFRNWFRNFKTRNPDWVPPTETSEEEAMDLLKGLQ